MGWLKKLVTYAKAAAPVAAVFIKSEEAKKGLAVGEKVVEALGKSEQIISEKEK